VNDGSVLAKTKEERWAPVSEAGKQIPVNAGEAATCLGADERGTGRRSAFCFEGSSVAQGQRKRERGSVGASAWRREKERGGGTMAGGSMQPAMAPSNQARVAPCCATGEPGDG
jgi:hypothetical protein